MKKFALCCMGLITGLLFVSNAGATSYVPASEPTYDTTNSSKPMFFANGTPITIAENPGKSGAIISWDGGSMEVPETTSVFGGSHEHEGVLESTNVVMTGGTVRNVFGGGLHKSHVATTNVHIKNGTVNGVQGGGASSMSGTTCHKPWYSGDADNAINRVDTANVTVDNGSIYLLYGGGEGISYTGQANLTVNGGTHNYTTAGGSNGFTIDANVIINGGTFDVVQSVNRGSMNSAVVDINGGNITNLYIGGETGDDTVTGQIANIDTNIRGGNVTNLDIGKSNGSIIPDTNDNVNVTYVNGTVDNIDLSQYNNITEYIAIIIDNQEYTVKKGETLSSLAILDSLKTKEGYTFKIFIDTATDSEFAEDTPITDSVALETVFEKNAVIENPKTGDNILSYVTLLIIGLGGLGVIGLNHYKKSYNN
ncbi:MAG: hypothetical protein V8Q75_02230 [Bacilli bacterium]